MTKILKFENLEDKIKGKWTWYRMGGAFSATLGDESTYPKQGTGRFPIMISNKFNCNFQGILHIDNPMTNQDKKEFLYIAQGLLNFDEGE